MASEFDYLRIKWPKLAALATSAARLVDASPSSAIGTMRTFAEWAADIALEQERLQLPPEATQMDKLEALENTGRVDESIISKFHEIRMKGNMAVHEAMGDVDSAHMVLEDMRSIARWLFDKEGNHLWTEEKGSDRTESRVPIGGLYNGSSGGSSFSLSAVGDFFRERMPIILIGILLIAIIVVVIFSVSRCSANNAAEEATPTPTIAVATATPAPTNTPAPTATPKPEIDLDTLELSNDFVNGYLYPTRWDAGFLEGPFSTEDKTYDSGFGMYIPSSAITEQYANVWATWVLSGDYDTLKFDIGVEKSGGYYGSQFGTFAVKILADDTTVYRTDGEADGATLRYSDFTFSDTDVEVDITGCRVLTLELYQKKGSGGTLNIVLGDIRLVVADGVVVEVTDATDTTDSGETTDTETD